MLPDGEEVLGVALQQPRVAPQFLRFDLELLGHATSHRHGTVAAGLPQAEEIPTAVASRGANRRIPGVERNSGTGRSAAATRPSGAAPTRTGQGTTERGSADVAAFPGRHRECPARGRGTADRPGAQPMVVVVSTGFGFG
ncbi:hypothetical protein GCM10023222_54580 [Saccharopolyspora cebuensis]